MEFGAPEWLALFPLWIFANWKFPNLALRQPLRLLCLLLLLLALVQPRILRETAGLDVWVLVDRSASTAEALAPRLPEWEELLDNSRSSDDRLFMVDYADVAMLRGEGDFHHFARPIEETRTALALQFALGKMDSARNNRLLILSDGYATEPLERVRERVLLEQVAVDYRLAENPGTVDYRIDSLQLPTQASESQTFLVQLDVSGPAKGSVPYTIQRNGVSILSGLVELHNGRGVVRFSDRLEKGGAYKYSALLSPETDAVKGNNQVRAWVEVEGTPAVLVLSKFRPDPVADALRARGFRVLEVENTLKLEVSHLSGVRAVIFNNIGASLVPIQFQQALDFFVREQGGGLIMLGGKNSFGSGGYFDSPIDPLLPVNMELREEHRKLAITMAIVMDRSGSMAAGVEGGMGGMTKMDLANEGAARTVDLLGPRDKLAVYAVDSESHSIVPLTGITGNQTHIVGAVRSIRSGGGGIFVYEGLSKAWKDIKGETGQKHIILFSDANDSEEPGAYEDLLEEMRAEKATVSVIGLGREGDVDAQLLKDVARLGEGRIFFVSNAVDLPAVFAQETTSVARSTFVDEPTGVQPTLLWKELASENLQWLSSVDGYNLNYLKKDASNAVLSTDEFKSPLISFWQRGLGRSAAVSFPMGGDYSSSVRSWQQYGDVVQTLTRWAMGSELPPGLALKTRMKGNQVQMELMYDHEWQRDFATHAPEIAISSTRRKDLAAPTWERMQPGRFQATLDLEPGEIVRGSIKLKSGAVAFGPVAVQQSPEWAFQRERAIELRELSRQSGGEERLDLTKIWNAPKKRNFYDLQPLLLTIFLLTFLTECLLSRLNFQFRWPAVAWKEMLHLPRIPRISLPRPSLFRRKKSALRPEPIQEATPDEVTVEEAAAPPKVEKNMRSIFEKAKRGGKN